MHKSRFCALVIDCPTDDLDAAARFWSEALGKPLAPPDPESPSYRELRTADDELILLVQKVDHAPRVHLDVEADDQEAEVARLEALGAKRVGKVRTWWVLEAPTGQRFCVVRPQRGPLEGRPHSNTWP